MLIGINAQKLFVTQDYRNAGISRYIGRLTRHLPEVPGTERFLLYTNRDVARWPEAEGPRLRLAPARTPTTHPLLRILWEQTVLPALALRDGVDLLHCPLNVRPVLARVPVVLTIHDLTFVRFPDRFHPLKQRYLAHLTRFSARRARRILADFGGDEAGRGGHVRRSLRAGGRGLSGGGRGLPALRSGGRHGPRRA